MLDVVADASSAFARRQPVPVCVAVLVIVVLIAVSIWMLERRVRAGGDRRVSAIATEHLSKWYGQVSGLNDVTVSVPPGITGLLGPNGAGKSTFMKLVTGQLKPSKGSIRVLGEPIWGNHALYRRIGFCPEQDAFYERMTGLEWVTALVGLNGLSEKETTRAARRALEAVDLLDAADRKIGGYSKGMRQRVKLAQAIAHDPELLILDEPLSGMDPDHAPAHDSPDQGVGTLGKERPRLEPHPPRSRVDDVEHPADQQRPHRRRRQRPPDSRAHRRASAHGVRPRRRSASGWRARCWWRTASSACASSRARVIIETARPDAFYARLTDMAASGEAGVIDEVTSPDDNLQAVFKYLVKQ